jgi:hypothetical protein
MHKIFRPIIGLTLLFVCGYVIFPKSTVNYAYLESLLSQRRWMEADIVTEKIIHDILVREIDSEKFNGFSKIDFLGFSKTKYLKSKGIPCKKIKIIDGLWMKYSNENFGLTTQAKIAISLKKNMLTLSGEQYFGWSIYDLRDKLGWYRNRAPYLSSEWYEPANRPENAVGFLPSDRWVLHNAGGGKPTYSYGEALYNFMKCSGLE